MEKILAALWAPGRGTDDEFGTLILNGLPRELISLGASRVRLNVRDGAVVPAKQLNQVWQNPQQDAVAQFWIPSVEGGIIGVRELFDRFSGRFAVWHVDETIVLPNLSYPHAVGERTWGWSQTSFLNFRPDIPKSSAISYWRGQHARVAVETQANFEYVQNIVLKPLTNDSPTYDAFVEECFSPEAMTTPAVLYDAVGDEAKLKKNVDEMMESCSAFLDFSRMDIIPTSQFDFTQSEVARHPAN